MFLVLKLPLHKIFVEQIRKLSEKWGIKKLPKMLKNLQIEIFTSTFFTFVGCLVAISYDYH